MNTENLISTMLEQHRELQKNIGLALSFSLKSGNNAAEIFQALAVFKNNLDAHLRLENDIFYVDLLKKMKEKKLDTSKTELFIQEMVKIYGVIVSFLNDYASADVIKNRIGEFRKILPDIIDALNLRIESEESGVYNYWVAL